MTRGGAVGQFDESESQLVLFNVEKLGPADGCHCEDARQQGESFAGNRSTDVQWVRFQFHGGRVRFQSHVEKMHSRRMLRAVASAMPDAVISSPQEMRSVMKTNHGSNKIPIRIGRCARAGFPNFRMRTGKRGAAEHV